MYILNNAEKRTYGAIVIGSGIAVDSLAGAWMIAACFAAYSARKRAMSSGVSGIWHL